MGKGGQKLARDSIPELGAVDTALGVERREKVVLNVRGAVIVRACCQNLSAVGTERRVKGPTQTVKGGDELARGRVPEVGAVVRACRQNPRTVGTKRAVPDPILMVKGGDELARGSVPELSSVIRACRQDPSTVRTKRGVQDTTKMIKRGNEFAGCRIPELCVVPACRKNFRAIRPEHRA